MILARHLGLRLVGWLLLALAMLLGVAALVSGVETARYGALVATRLALLEAPVLVLPLTPLLCAVAAGLAAARLLALGEADAIEAMGWSPRRLALVPLTVGLVAGMGLGLAQDRVVPSAAEASLELRRELGALPPGPDWIWVGEEAVRVDDGLRVRAEAGELSAPASGDRPGPADARRARALAWPSLARNSELLTSDALPLRIEALSRIARPVACGLLAVLAWVGPSRLRRERVAPAVALALVYESLTLGLQAQAAQGTVAPAVAALLPLVLVAALLGWRLWWTERPPGPAAAGQLSAR